MSKIGISTSVLLFVFFCTAFASKNDSYKFTKEFQTSYGTVTFDHEAHAMGRVKDCADCHSALKTFGGQVSELFAHNFCKACHETRSGPTECNGCHGRKKVVLK